MKISYSLLASNHLDLINHLNEKASQFDSIHFDFIDETYAGGLGLSVITLEQLCEFSNFEIDVHILMKNHKAITERICDKKINNIFYHIEFSSPEDFKQLNTGHAEKGIAIKLDYPLESLKKFMPYTDSVLLLCMEPSLNLKSNAYEPIKRVEEFKHFYPEFTGNLIVDGGVRHSDIPRLEELNVNTAVVGTSYIN